MTRPRLQLALVAVAVLALVLAPVDLTDLGIPYAGLRRYGTYILTLVAGDGGRRHGRQSDRRLCRPGDAGAGGLPRHRRLYHGAA